MRQTTEYDRLDDCKTVTTAGLMKLLSSGRPTAEKVGNAAGARVQVGRRVLWNTRKIQQYLDEVSQ